MVQDILEISLDSNAETATIPESIKTLITVMDICKILENSNMKTATITVMDIHEISENSNMKTATIPESMKTSITVMDICEISENSNTKTATTPESEEISKISLNAFLVYRLNVYTACIQLLVDVTKALCQREREML